MGKEGWASSVKNSLLLRPTAPIRITWRGGGRQRRRAFTHTSAKGEEGTFGGSHSVSGMA
jgi:hypothetical protein